MSNVLDHRARSLLEAMGIDVWRARRGASAADPGPGTGTQTFPPNRTARDDRPRSPLVPLVDAPVAAAPPVAPFRILSLSRAGVLLLLELADFRAGRRFAVDLLGAATGVWGGAITQLVFEWPQPGIPQSSDAVTRALGAFVDKQLGDHPDALILLGAEVVARLPSGLPEGCLALPPFESLMIDAALKRSLWQELIQRARP